MPLRPIAITGKLRSGKDSAAAYLVDRYGYTRFAFGDELKRLAHEIFDVPMEPKPRDLYQWFGQTMRQRDPDVWVRKCFERISYMYRVAERNNGTLAKSLPVLSDVRQPNEFTRCRSEGYVIIRIVRPEFDRLAAATATDTFSPDDLRHDTESHVDGFSVDYEIVNDGTLDELYRKIDFVMTKINGGVQ